KLKSNAAVQATNWVFKFNALQRLFKLICGYFEEMLGQNVAVLEHPNLTLIARDASTKDIVAFVILVLGLTVQCSENKTFIDQIQRLSPESQTVLMHLIEKQLQKSQERAG
ncbi:hypothetical protein HDU91_004391, partial [Kappamyces sp. JEL0680]